MSIFARGRRGGGVKRVKIKNCDDEKLRTIRGSKVQEKPYRCIASNPVEPHAIKRNSANKQSSSHAGKQARRRLRAAILAK